MENLGLVINSKILSKINIKVGYNFDVMRQSACLVLNPIVVYNYGFLFNYMTVGQASDSMTASTYSFHWWVGAWCLSLMDPPWLNLRFSLALTICESWALFFVSSWCVNLMSFIFLFCLVFAMSLCASVYMCFVVTSWERLTSWHRLWCPTMSLSLSHWYPGSGVVLGCIDSWSLHPPLLW